MFQNAVARPVFQLEQADGPSTQMGRRFIGFIWMSAWTILITGILMMLMSTRFVWFAYSDTWSILLGLKQIVFLLMVVYAFGYARMLSHLSTSSEEGSNESVDLYRLRVHQYRTISIFLGITAILLAAGMR